MEVMFIFSIAILIMSVVAHEVAHAWSAELLGDPTPRLAGRLTLNPLRHLDLFGSLIVPLITFFAGGIIFGWAKPVVWNPYNIRNARWGEGLIAFAGPLTNLLIALFFSLIIRFVAPLYPLPLSFIDISQYIILINITLAIFNLVPVPPLDGSKILFMLIPPHYQHVREMIERYSMVLILIFIFVLWRFITPVIPWLYKIFTGLSF
ncbi:MAG TPA: site-2 protease family protein [Candidatus Paceibacterota bacterium]